MNQKDIKKILSKFPDTPGVYMFLARRGGGKHKNKIIYIGKATSLRNRVRSYFSADILNTRGPLISKMLEKFNKVEHIKTDSVLEALILEAHLIKKHQPEANTIDKDDKSFNFVVITKDPIRTNGLKRPTSNGAGDFPAVSIIRGRELLNNKPKDVLYSFGPFTNSGQLKEALKLIRKMFPYRDKCIPCEVQLKSFPRQSASSLRQSATCRPCFSRQVGLCPGVCTGEITKSEYARQIKNIVLFFEGKKKQLVKNLEKQMRGFAKKHEFEKANITKRTIFALNHIRDVSLIKSENIFRHDSASVLRSFRIESYDIAHMSGQNVVGVMTVIEGGEVKKSDYRKFKIKNDPGANDTKALSEILERRLAHIEWPFPGLIVVDGGVAQKKAVEKILHKNNVQIPVVSVVKDERHKPREILGDKKWLKLEREILLSNSEAHRFGINYHKQLRGRII